MGRGSVRGVDIAKGWAFSRARMHHKVVRHYFQSCSDFESKHSNFMCMGRKLGSFSK